MRLIICCILLYLTPSICQAQAYKQIRSEQIKQTDTFFGQAVEDPYRWLEEINAVQTQTWIDQQNRASQKYLASTTQNLTVFEPILRNDFTQFKYMRKMGKYYFSYLRTDKTNAPSLYYQPSLNGLTEKIIDPRNISVKDEIEISNYALSPDSKLLAYTFSRKGSDYKEIKIVAIRHAEELEDHLTGIKFSSIAWQGNGFYYNKASQEGQFGGIENIRVYYHTVGTKQSEDIPVLDSKKNSTASRDFFTTDDGRYFFLTEEIESKGILNIYYRDTESKQTLPLLNNIHYSIHVIGIGDDNKVVAITSKDAPNRRIIAFDKDKPLEWQTIVPELEDAVLEDVHLFRDRIITVYRNFDHPVLIIWDYKGKMLHKLDLPVASSVDGFSGSRDEEEVLFSYTSYIIPPVLYSLNIKTFKAELVERPTVTFDASDIEEKVVEYTASDGAKVPMTLVYKKGINPDGNNPALLEAYGGFGISSDPSFDPGIVYFVQQGGVFAFAHIRGGGEKGPNWHKAGSGIHKQRSFNDFIDAAEYLVHEKYTTPKLLATTGTSNGGLVVAAAATQRPDLFKVVIPVAAPLDMIRFERFTIGVFHKDEYGTVTDSNGFKRILHYSPYANIKDSVNYPAMLIFAADNDDRVPPFHSYKFAARLQSRNSQENTVLLKVQRNAGHNGASGWLPDIQFKADLYTFIMKELYKK